MSYCNKKVIQNQVYHKVSYASPLEPIISLDKYTNFTKVIRLLSFVFKFTNKLKHSYAEPKQYAKIYQLTLMQNQSFGKKIQYLQNSQTEQISKLVTFFFLDENGLFPSRGRISKTKINRFDVIYSVLLSPKHDLTRLIIRDTHERCRHLGISSTLNKLSLSGFWVPKSRQTIRNYISSFYLCRKYNTFI